MDGLKSRLTPLVVGGSLLAGLLLCLAAALLLGLFRPPALPAVQPTALLTVLAAPTATSALPPIFDAPTATAVPVEVGGISVGAYVQISGTDGAGLRLRSGAGTGYDQLFLGYDSEVFKVIDGPIANDGYTWWRLEAPYDTTRSGWAAANYLAIVSENP
ncbi:MAG TPA: SH3 domain-containing protein [Anaerolineaceae bacterium]|nr:SH3 domain-containing protein [Anaerolineaceae bacterium]